MVICKKLKLKEFYGEHFKAVFDFANFVSVTGYKRGF